MLASSKCDPTINAFSVKARRATALRVAPYLALIPELATDGRARTRLSTLLALVSFSVLGLYAAAWPYGIELGRQLGASSENAVRGVVVLSLGVSA